MYSVYCSVLWLSRLCWLYNRVCYGCHGHVGCILQCAAVVFTMLNAIIVKTMFVVYCSAVRLSLPYRMYIAVCCCGHYCV